MDGQVDNSADSLIEPLTRREREILSLLSQDLTAPEIAQKLTLAVSSVKWYIQQVYGKLGVNGRRQAVARARELGLLQRAVLLPQSSAAPDTPPRARHNLPQQLTRLIGREREIEAIRQLLTDDQQPATRLVTLVGPGGAGKTRLSLAIAGDLLTAYSDGLWLVEVAALSDPELLAQTVAASLGLREMTDGVNLNLEASRPLLSSITDFLQGKHCLLVLDNCEHLVEACARLTEYLLRACPRLQFIATSREALGVPGEAVWPVPGLAMPPANLPMGLVPEHAAEYAAVQLFGDRARAARPGFSVTAQNAASLAQVCRQLDGLPLAIELAAARVALLPVEQIAALLAAHDGFRLLTGGGRTALPRHQTLMATIDWSYQLLSERERTLLRRLPVCAGSWTLAAAEAICADRPSDERQTESGLPAGAVFETLSQLSAKSLVISEDLGGVEARFRMLETIREFALGKLEQSDDVAAVRHRHFEFFLDLAERAEPGLRGRDQLTWLDRLEADHDNLRRALEWVVQSREAAAGLRLASAISYFWDVRGYSYEAHSWFKRLLAVSPAPEPSAGLAFALARAAHFAAATCSKFAADWRSAEVLGEASLALSRELGAAGQLSAAYALLALGWIRFWQHSPEIAALQQVDPALSDAQLRESVALFTALLSDSLALFEAAGDDWGRASVLLAIGFAAKMAGDYHQAVSAGEQSQALFEQLGDLRGMVRALEHLGQVADWYGQFQRAADLHEAAIGHFRRLRDWDGYATASWTLAHALDSLGHYERAMAAVGESIALLRSIGHLNGVPWFLSDQAAIAYAYGEYEEAAALLEESRMLANKWGGTDWVAWLEVPLARLVRAKGDPARALSMVENVLPVFRAGGHKWWMAFAQQVQGEALLDLGEYERAAAFFNVSLAWYRARASWREVTALLLLLSSVARRQGDSRRAAGLLDESLLRCQSSGLRPLLAKCLAEAAYLSNTLVQADSSLAQAERAARLLGAHEMLCRAMDLPIPPVDHAERVEYDRAGEDLRTCLGEARFAALWAEGGAMTTEAAARYALAALDKGQA
jgi:predicted ATPase/DNA-binding CsgD family transcriptional regulator